MNTRKSARIFISYSTHDVRFASELYEQLEMFGFDVWMAKYKIKPGDHWDMEVHQALERCTILLVVYSTYTFRSITVWDEISFVLNRHKVVIPLLLKNVPLPFRIERLQYVDFSSPDYKRSLTQLLIAIQLANPDPTNPDGSPVKQKRDTNQALKSSADTKPLPPIKDENKRNDDKPSQGTEPQDDAPYDRVSAFYRFPVRSKNGHMNHLIPFDVAESNTQAAWHMALPGQAAYGSQTKLILSIDDGSCGCLNTATNITNAGFNQRGAGCPPPTNHNRKYHSLGSKGENMGRNRFNNNHKLVMREINEIVEQAFKRPHQCLPLFDLERQKFTT